MRAWPGTEQEQELAVETTHEQGRAKPAWLNLALIPACAAVLYIGAFQYLSMGQGALLLGTGLVYAWAAWRGRRQYLAWDREGVEWRAGIVFVRAQKRSWNEIRRVKRGRLLRRRYLEVLDREGRTSGLIGPWKRAGKIERELKKAWTTRGQDEHE